MNPGIPEPAADAPIIDWAKPVTRALTALSDKIGAAARNERGAALPKLRPWEVHYFPDAADGDGAWGVYLPAGSLNVAGEEIVPADASGNALVALGAKWPGYYAVPTSASQPDAVWLHVFTLDNADDSGTDAGDSSSGGGTGGSGGSSVESSPGCVAVVGDAADIAAPEGCTLLTAIRICAIDTSGAITQLIVGAIALGGSGSGGTDVTVRNPSNLVADIEEMPTDPSAEGYESGHEGDFKITFGNLKIGDGQGGTTKGEIYIDLGEAGYIPARRIVPGDNIHIDVQGKNIVISADVESTTEGFTGTRTVLKDVDYDTAYQQLRRRYATETWVDGLLQQTVVGDWEAYTTAVEETVVTTTN